MPEPTLTVTTTMETTGDSIPFASPPIRRLKRPNMNPPQVPGKTRPSPAEIHLSFNQSFKNQATPEDVHDNDLISSLEFNRDGSLLAFGDKGGYVHVYEGDINGKTGSPKYSSHISFQSHEAEFDYLKSIDIEEKISQIKWLPTTISKFLLAANDRTIKLWKIGDQRKYDYGPPVTASPGRLVLPKPLRRVSTRSSQLKKCYQNGHTYHINTVSVNNDQQTFMSSDDLRINLWDIERTDSSYVIVDIKPESMDNLREVITTSAFHPNCHNLFMYSTSTGATNQCDMRVGALCDTPQRTFKEDQTVKGFYSEVIASIADAQYSHCGTFLATRDLMTVKVWDTRMGITPLLAMPVQEYVRPNLNILYETDLIFDKFSVSWSRRDNRIITGSYNDLFCILEPNVPRLSCGSASFRSSMFQVTDVYKGSKHHVLKPLKGFSSYNNRDSPGAPEARINEEELTHRCLYAQWHPNKDVVAISSFNQVYLFTEKRLFNL